MTARYAFAVATAIAIIGAMIHWVAPLLGPDWYAFLHAPDYVVQSARDGTWRAPVGAVVIGGLMALCAVYALSGAGVVRKMPLLRTALVVITTLCLVRALLLVPLHILVPKQLTAFDVVGSLVWLLAGVAFLIGTTRRWSQCGPIGEAS